MRRLPTIFEAASPASTAHDLVASDRVGREYERQLIALAATSDQACSKGDWRGVAAVQAQAEVLLAEAASWQRRHEALLATAYRLVRARDRAMTRARHAVVCRASRPRTPRRRRCAASRARSSGDDGDGGDGGDGDGPVDRRTRDPRALALVTIPPLSQEGSAMP